MCIMIWLVIADSSACKIYHYDKKNKNIMPIKEMYHRESKLKSSDLVSSAPGHYKTSGPTRGSYEPHEAPKEVEIEKFAREIAKDIIADKNKNKFENLILFIPPHMSGLVHEHLDNHNHIKDIILHDSKKDFTHVPIHEMYSLVEEEMSKSRNMRNK